MIKLVRNHAQRLVRSLPEDVRNDVVALLQTAHERGREAEALAERQQRAREGVEREANALAAVVADLLDGRVADDVVDDLPHDARRRVVAYRHQSSPMRHIVGGDQFGRLPDVPPRASVMRQRVRVYDESPTQPEEGTTSGP